ncbi:hypothetical protein, conserved [Eimeria necatrix]|uniref:Uncharacterized protein n=1 Tax=Eimeria necatrix TaxID=51315 RepID=U6MGG0_9EIME|nr:hypothetical protein, conserved [Eimeria necatrix]CDJ63347.1 hypothetical protein, conserved [Eimeria necatrix]
MALGSQQGPTSYCETQADRDDAKGTDGSHDDFDSLLEPLNFSRQPKVSGEAEYAYAKGDSKERPFVARIGEQLFSLAQLVRSIGAKAERQASEGSGESQSSPDPQTAHPLKYLPLAAGVLTCIWGWRAARSIERVVALRYSDIAYQIRRPDALTSRISAFKFLVLGGLVLPSSAVAFASWQSRKKPAQPLGLSKASQDMHAGSQELPSVPSPRRLLLADMLPVSTQAELRRLAQSFHRGFSEFVEAVTPSKEKWAHWAAGARASHTTGLHNPSAWTSRIATFPLPDSKAAD